MSQLVSLTMHVQPSSPSSSRSPSSSHSFSFSLPNEGLSSLLLQANTTRGAQLIPLPLPPATRSSSSSTLPGRSRHPQPYTSSSAPTPAVASSLMAVHPPPLACFLHCALPAFSVLHCTEAPLLPFLVSAGGLGSSLSHEHDGSSLLEP